MKSNRSGMTLTEIMIAVAILAGVIVVIMGTLISGLEAFQKAVAYNYAAIIAQRTINNCQSINYDDVESLAGMSVDGDFFVEVKITEKSYLATDINYKKVTVTVTNSVDKTVKKKVKVTMTTYLFPYT